MAIDQFKFGCDRNVATQQNELAAKSLAMKKTENNIAAATAAAATTSATAEMIANEPANAEFNDMETLYWHTHGSLLWQH